MNFQGLPDCRTERGQSILLAYAYIVTAVFVVVNWVGGTHLCVSL